MLIWVFAYLDCKPKEEWYMLTNSGKLKILPNKNKKKLSLNLKRVRGLSFEWALCPVKPATNLCTWTNFVKKCFVIFVW